MTNDELVEKVARARCEVVIRFNRRWDTELTHLEEMLPRAVDENWRNFIPEIADTLAIAMPAAFEMAAEVADAATTRHFSPVGDSYTCGAWDQGVRIATAIRAEGETWK